mgnify:CR=1 FL=1
MSEEEKKINTLFDMLDKWRLFPAYQLERRADIFFAIYLKQILESDLKITVDNILPEFPIRVGSLYNKENKKSRINLSFKIDYIAFSNKSRKIYFIELKTDVDSKREKQNWYLKTATQVGFIKLLEGLLDIYSATEQKRKYTRYISELQKMAWIKEDNNKYFVSSKDYNIETIIIQPRKTKKEEFKVITFQNIVRILSSNKDFLSGRFIKSLKKWKTNPN